MSLSEIPERTQLYYNEEGYLSLMKKIITSGQEEKNDRTKVGTRYSFGETVIHELYGNKVCMMSSRKIGFKTVLEELLFFIRGDTDTNNLKSSIWKGNTTKQFIKNRGLDYNEGVMGPMYGWQWRHCGEKYTGPNEDYKGYDQFSKLLESLLHDPSGRRHIISSWIPNDIEKGVLAPCHVLQQYQFQSFNDQLYLDCLLFQRSADLALAGMSFNALSYSILLNMICAYLRQNGVKVMPGKLVHNIGNAHVYSNHIENVKIQVERNVYPYPTLELTGDFSDLTRVDQEQFTLNGYKSCEKLKYDMAV